MEFFATMVAISTSSFLSVQIEIYTSAVVPYSTNTVLWRSTFAWLHRPSVMNHHEAVSIRSTIDPFTEKYNRMQGVSIIINMGRIFHLDSISGV
jgi:hypothetical protein